MYISTANLIIVVHQSLQGTFTLEAVPIYRPMPIFLFCVIGRGAAAASAGGVGPAESAAVG